MHTTVTHKKKTQAKTRGMTTVIPEHKTHTDTLLMRLNASSLHSP